MECSRNGGAVMVEIRDSKDTEKAERAALERSNVFLLQSLFARNFSTRDQLILFLEEMTESIKSEIQVEKMSNELERVINASLISEL